MLFSWGIGGKHHSFFYKALWDLLIKQLKVVSEHRMSTPIKQPRLFYGPKKVIFAPKLPQVCSDTASGTSTAPTAQLWGVTLWNCTCRTFICSTRTTAQFAFPGSRKRLIHNNSSYTSSASSLGPTLSSSCSPGRGQSPGNTFSRGYWGSSACWSPSRSRDRQRRARSSARTAGAGLSLSCHGTAWHS